MSQTNLPDAKVLSPVTQILGGVTLLVLLPFFVFGGPGYYGDDLHLLGALGDRGFTGAIQQWFEHYGAGYRPLGIALDFAFYDLTGNNPVVSYAINTGVFLLIALAIYRSMVSITGDETMAVFVAAFYALFPFGPTAYLQLSSFCMLVAILITVPFMGGLLSSSRRYESWAGAWGVAAVWVAVLLVYEQPAGLYAFLAIGLLASLHAGSPAHTRMAVVRLGTAMTICTVVFFVLYLMHPGNPKIVSLKAILTQNAVTTAAPGTSAPNAATLAPVVSAPTPLAAAEALPTGQSRGGKLLSFFSHNVDYALRNLLSEPLGLLASASALALVAHGLFRIHVHAIPQPMAVRYALFGTLWTFLTILPFFLYGRFTAPPYVFVLSSIGAGVAAYGLYWAVLPAALGFFFRFTFLKVLFCGMASLFVLQQYGYFLGLKDELRYSRALAERVAPAREALLRGAVLTVEGVPGRPHGHIFWLEKAVGHRAFISALGDDFHGIEIRQKSMGTLEISIPQPFSRSIETEFLPY
jgi:hypothetical protein